jgi:beta-amylase
MLPLSMFDTSGNFYDKNGLDSQLAQLASGGVEGVMSDIWWGLVETSPETYNFDPYLELVEMVNSHGLKFQAVMSFHQCGGNVGDDCNIPLPSWVLDVGSQNSDIWYKDQYGNADSEYISLFVDNEKLFPSSTASSARTPLMMYKDFMNAFAKAFSSYLGSTILEVEIGTGPSGELRYPSYPSNKWTFPGVGGFQSYSSYALDSLQEAATAIGHPEWALVAGPSNAGGYNSYPDDTTFFSEGKQSENNYQSAYGDFYLGWYASSLIEHGDAILGKAEAVFTGMSVSLSVKVAGIHWWYFHPSHAAELTAGYYNLDTYYSAQPVAEDEEGKVSSHLLISQPFARYAPSSLRGGSKKADGSYQGGSSYGYDGIASMIASHKGTTFLFTCLEMQDSEQSSSCDCGPYELVGQTK